MDQAEQLRNVIKQKSQEVPPHTARVVTITSGKGGVGKSNIAVNMAVELRKMGNRVIIFDADFGLANVEVMFGAVPQYNLSDLIYRGKSIREIITTGPMDIGFNFWWFGNRRIEQSLKGSDHIFCTLFSRIK